MTTYDSIDDSIDDSIHDSIHDSIDATRPSLADLLARAAQQRPDRVALRRRVGGRLESWTYRGLHDDAARVRAHLEALGVEAGQRLVVLGPLQPTSIAVVIAASSLRVQTAFVSEGLSVDELERSWAAIEAQWIVVGTSRAATRLRSVRAVLSGEVAVLSPDEGPDLRPEADDAAGLPPLGSGALGLVGGPSYLRADDQLVAPPDDTDEAVIRSLLQGWLFVQNTLWCAEPGEDYRVFLARTRPTVWLGSPQHLDAIEQAVADAALPSVRALVLGREDRSSIVAWVQRRLLGGWIRRATRRWVGLDRARLAVVVGAPATDEVSLLDVLGVPFRVQADLVEDLESSGARIAVDAGLPLEHHTVVGGRA